jgi:PAS domain S-box-containing protein
LQQVGLQSNASDKSESMVSTSNQYGAVCLTLTRAISRTRMVEEIYAAALDALSSAVGVERASILLFDRDGVMRFKAYRGLSEAYRRAVEGHTPWTPHSLNPEPIVVSDVARDPSLGPFLGTIEAEGIAAMTFIPLVSLERVIGKFMLYYDVPHAPSVDELQLAGGIATFVAFAVDRTRTEEQARRSEERLRFALDAASMGTWDWDLSTDTVRWSDNLERIHGLPPGTFDGTFSSYEREIHPEDRERVLASARRALAEGAPHDVEYRVVSANGTVRWCEGKGRVEYHDGRPVRMSGVCMIVTRRKEAELARLAAAEEASRLKDEFLATLSHELRTPLNAIVGWTQMLQSGDLPPARASQAIDVIARNARLQTQLIEDILDVSRIISGKLEIEPASVSIPHLIEAVVAGVTPTASSKHITLTSAVPSDLPPIEGDPKRLHQVLNNVLSNALKFTPEGGHVALRGALENGCITITIRDSGTGIAPDFMPHVFERFRQADSRATRRHGGLGLGLAIARHLVEQHGGDVSAESDGAGQGTTVTVRLPTGTEAPHFKSSATQRLSATEVKLDGLSVLVVDDQPDSRELFASLLEERGADVARCESATSALALASSHPFQLLVADIAMPDIDGYELIRRLRARGIDMPAIAVTADAGPDDRQQALAAGFTDYRSKPVDATDFLHTVRALVASH